MKKTTIFLTIGLILVAILTGCQDKVSYPPYPSAVFIEQTEDFLEGQSFNSENFKVVVRYFDGSETEYPNAGLKLSGTDGIVNSGDTVSISVGTDVNGREVKNEITLDVYKLGNVTAETKKESYTVGETPKAEDLTVTAHYEGSKTLVLKATDYTVTKVAINEGAEDPTKETVPGHFTVTVSSAIAAAGTPGSTYDVPVTVAQTAYTGNIVSVDGIAAYGLSEDSTSFRLGKLNYTGSEDLPAIDASKVMIAITVDAESGKTTDYVAADKIEGLKLSYVSMVSGEALDDRYDGYAFTNTAADTDTGVGIVATYGETTTAPLALQIDQNTNVELQYGGKGIVEGTALNDEKNPAIVVSDYRVYLTVNGEKTLVDDVTAADFSFFSAETGETGVTDNKMPAEGSSVYVSVDYKGSVSNRVDVESLGAAPVVYTITDVELKEDSAKIYKQIYSTVPSANASVIKSVTIDGVENPITTEFTSNGITAILSASNTEIVEFELDENGKLDLSAVNTVYLAVSYKPSGAEDAADIYFEPIQLQEPTIKALTLSADYSDKDSSSNPMFGTDIEWTLTATTNESGTLVLNPENATYWLNGQSAKYSELPTTVSDKEVKVLAVYAGVESGTTAGTQTPVPAGTAYIDPDGISVEPTEALLKAVYIGDKYSTAATNSSNVETYYELKVADDAHVGGTVTGDSAGKIDTVVPPSSVAVLNEKDNKVTVKVSYLAEDGTTKTKDCVVTFDAQSWATETETDSLDVTINGEISLATSKGSSEDAVDLLKGGNYTIAVTGLTEHGDAAYAVSVEATEGTATLDGNTLTIGGYTVAKITVSYIDNSGASPAEKSVDFYVKNSSGV